MSAQAKPNDMNLVQLHKIVQFQPAYKFPDPCPNGDDIFHNVLIVKGSTDFTVDRWQLAPVYGNDIVREFRLHGQVCYVWFQHEKEL